MDTPPPEVPFRTVKGARAALESLRSEANRLNGALRALEAHPGYRLLATTRTKGDTKQIWDHVRSAVDELSTQLRTCQATLDRAGTVLASRTRLGRSGLDEVARILRGAVTLEVSPSGQTFPRSLAEFMAQMEATRAVLVQSVSDVYEYSASLQQRLDRLATALPALHTEASAPHSRDQSMVSLVEGLMRELAEISPIILADPIGCVSTAADGSESSMLARLRRLNVAVDDAQTYMSTLRGQQAEWHQYIVRLREHVEEVGMAEQECRRVESEVRARIAGLTADDALNAAPDLRTHLDRLRVGGTGSRMAQLFREFEQDCAAAIKRATARRTAAQDLLDQREELRGRLDSYRAMLIWHGFAEDLELADIYERVYQLLWTAPCNLDQAATELAGYQQAAIERIEASG